MKAKKTATVAKKSKATKGAPKKTSARASVPVPTVIAHGLPLLLVEESRELPLIELTLAARTGSRWDAAGKEGALSLALRSLRRGAGARGAHAIDDELDRLGADFGTSADASSASISVTVLTRNFAPTLELLSDLVLRPHFPRDELAQVVRETRAELVDLRNDDRSLAARNFRRHLFAGHPYGRPVAGTLSSLDALTSEDALGAYGKTFTRDNLVVGASGDISRDELAKALEPLLKALPAGPGPERGIPEPTPPSGRRLVIVDKPARTQTQIYIGGMGMHPFDDDREALVVGNTIFGGTFTARLTKEVRSKRGWSYGASSRLGRDRAREAWAMWTFPAAKDAAACIALELALLEQLLDEGVTDREVSFVKSYLTRSHAFDVDTASKRLWLGLDEAVAELPRGYHTGFIDRVQSVTKDQVNAALRRRLSRDNLWVCVSATASELRGDLEKAIPGLRETLIVPFDADQLPQPR